MQMTERIELNTRRDPKKPEYLVIKTFDGGIVYLNHQPIGGTPYEAIGVLKKAIVELEGMGKVLTAIVQADQLAAEKANPIEKDACQCLLKSLLEKSELPYGCGDCCAE